MTRLDAAQGPPWLIVGTRPDGDRLVLASGHREALETTLAAFRERLEGYASIDLELVSHLPPCESASKE